MILPHGLPAKFAKKKFLLILLYKNKIHKNTCIESLFYKFLEIKTVTTISLKLCSLSLKSESYNILWIEHATAILRIIKAYISGYTV